MTEVEEWRKTALPQRRRNRYYEFVPRLINPVKIRQVVIFAADEEVRLAGARLPESMPWVEVSTLTHPAATTSHISPRPSVFIFDDTAMSLVGVDEIRKNNKDAVLALLSFNPFIHGSPPSAAEEKFPYTSRADLVFATNRHELPPSRVIPSVVRAAEDRVNIERYSKARRFIFLIVDDEPRWFSQFLPVLYNIIGQRADVMITRTYEETLAFLFGVETESDIDGESYRLRGHGDDVVCLITDVFFPRGRDLAADAGRDLIALARKYYPRYPIIIASKAKEAADLKNDEAFLMPKGDPGSLERLQDYILNFTGMGDFLIRDERGGEIRRVRNIREMYGILQEAETDTEESKILRDRLKVYGDNDRFSTWLYMHSFSELGDTLRPLRLKGRELVRTLKRHLRTEMRRVARTPLIIDEVKVFSLPELLSVLQTVDPEKIQSFADRDAISSWLDRKGYPELAEELRPIHGSGARMVRELVEGLEKWIDIYRQSGTGL